MLESSYCCHSWCLKPSNHLTLRELRELAYENEAGWENTLNSPKGKKSIECRSAEREDPDSVMEGSSSHR